MKNLLFFSCLLLSITAYSQEKRLALVIGNSAYEHGGALKNPVNDANLMASTLMDLGFDVMKRTDATKQDMDAAILDYWRKLASYDVTLFYYAGHGIQVGGVNYLLPVDAALEDELALQIEAVDVGKVISQFERFPNNINIVILDACRDNPFRSWLRGGSGGFVAMPAPSGTIIAFATSAGATASDGSGANGLYTEKLTHQMNIEQRIEDVFIRTRNEVRAASNGRQNPQEWSQLTGIFHFLGGTELVSKQQVINQQVAIQPEHNRTQGNEFSPIEVESRLDMLTYEERRFYRVHVFKEGERVKGKELKEIYSTNLDAKKSFRWTRYKLYSGWTIGLIGSTYFLLGVWEATYWADPLGLLVSAGSAVVPTGGILLLKSAKNSHIRSLDYYNNVPTTGIKLGPTANGFGLVYNF